MAAASAHPGYPLENRPPSAEPDFQTFDTDFRDVITLNFQFGFHHG